MRLRYLALAILMTATAVAAQLDGGFTLRKSDTDDLRVHLNLQFGDSSNYGRTFDRAAFSDVKPGGDRITFALRREPGVFTFEGRGTMDRAAGWYDFVPNAAFQREMGRLGFQDVEGRALFVFALDDLTIDKVKRLQGLVTDPLDTEKLVRLINHGAGFAYIEAMTDLGFRKLSSDEYRRARDHGVSAPFVRDMADLGMKLPLDQLIRARDHGVTPKFVTAMRQLGYNGLALPDYVRIRDHGVTPEFVTSMREAGYPKITTEELVKLRNHGISANFVRKVQEIFKRTPTVDEIIRFRTRGDIDWARDK